MTIYTVLPEPQGAVVQARAAARRAAERERKRAARRGVTPEQREQERAAECERKREARRQVTPELREQERAAERERKRQARRVTTPEARERERERRAALEHRVRERERKRAERSARGPRPFLAIDGEGGGTDAVGRQNYLLMVAANADMEFTLQRDGKPLGARDCLEWILALPPRPTLVAFGLGYDATQILRGMKPQTLRGIMNPPHGKNGPSYTYWGDFAVIYQQGQYLRVARIDRSSGKPVIVKGSSRTIYETLGFFQTSFVKVIEHWGVGSAEERAVIAANKERRNEFDGLTDEMIRYCTLECRHLAMVMEEFRTVCSEAGILPRQWAGAGHLAAALLDMHNVPKRPRMTLETAALAERKPSARPEKPRRPERDPDFEIAAAAAYYGGRFETGRIGYTAGPVYEYDLRSAYPAAMSSLPCPLHTEWIHKPYLRSLPKTGLFVAHVSFEQPDKPWCGLPFRSKGGTLHWPRAGRGLYWSPEFLAARRCLGAKITVIDLWQAQCKCRCRPFDWVEALFEERRRLGSKTRGYPLKLGLNSLYGKLAQRCGRGPYHDVVAAGLITVITRARLVEALSHDPEAVVMLATDALFSTRPLPLDIGDGLGQWEAKEWPDLFIVQPGVYWSPARLETGLKSRGAPRSVIGDAAPRFEETFREWFALMARPEARRLLLEERKMPTVPVTVRVFYGCRLALARGKPWQAGIWKDETRSENFEWKTKRDPMRVDIGDGHLVTYPYAGNPFAESEAYQPANFDRAITISRDDGNIVQIDENDLLEGMPDFTPFLPHE